ncbi:multi-sensor signal transduction histidine kinase [Kalymmatonema gypsitolerans NIES-4073]|nr:multi-sensor signal transduction histidine kinase [Scytonema sp. NIES-4073]
MHAFAQFISLPSLDSAIDFSPLSVAPDTPLLDVVALMSQRQPQAGCALIVENLQVVGWFTEHDALQLLYSDVNLQTAKISEVMETSVITLKCSEVSSVISILSFLREYRLYFIPLVDEQSQLVGLCTYESICQALEQEAGETRGELRQTEAQGRLLEAAVVNGNDAVVIIEAQGLDDPLGWRMVYVNEAFTRMSGWSADEIIGKTLPTLYGEKTSSTEIDRICTALRDGSSIRTEFINHHKNGCCTYWVEVNIAPIAYCEGKITHFVCTQRDITERKLAEEALRASEELFRQTAEDIRQVLFVRDLKQDKVIYVNPGYEEICGRSRDRLYENPKDFIEAIHPQDRARVIAASKTFDHGDVYTQEYRIVRPDGEERWVWTRAVPVKNELGEYRIFGISEDITEQKRATEALRESEERFRKLADEAPVLIWMNDANASGTFVNQYCLEFTGRPLEELLGEGWAEGIHPEDKQRCFEIYLSAFKKHQRFQYVCRYLHADGEYRWLINMGVPRFASDGSFIGYIGCCTDITERMQAEAALQQAQAELQQANAELEMRVEERTRAVNEMNRQLISEMSDRLYAQEQLRQSQEMLQLVMDNIPQSIFWKDTASVFLGCNRIFAEIAGLESPEDIVGKTDYDLLPQKEEADLYRESDLRVMQSDTPEYGVIIPHLQKDGTQLWLEVSRIPLHDAEGNVIGVLGTCEDITERRQAQEALKRSKERFRNLVETSSDWVWEVDENTVYTYASPKIYDLLGYQPQFVLGKTPFDLMPPQEAERVANIFAPIAAAQQPFKCLENTNTHKDGHLVICETSGVPIFDGEGKFRGYRGVGRDITVRKLREAVLRETQEQLQAILDNSPAFIHLLDTENKFLLVNHQYEKHFKISKEQIVGKTLYDFWPDDIAHKLTANSCKVIREGIPIEVEEVVPHEDGLHTYLCVKFPLKDANGIPYAVCGISTDITERKLAEESLLRFRKAIESSSNAIGMADMTRNVIYLNPAFVELFGYTLEELRDSGGPPAIYTNQAECERIFATVNKGESWRGEVTMKTRSGRIIEIELHGDAIKDTTGKIIGSVGIHTDITERKQAEESLQLRDRAIAASSNGIIIADVTMPNSPIIYANPALEQITGYSVVEVIGQNSSFLHSADLNQPGITEVHDAITQGKSCTVVLRNYRKDGTLFWNEISISPVYDIHGRFTHYIGIQTDITERKQAEVAVLISQERLQYLLSSSPGVIYSCKIYGDHSITFMSENVVSMLGYEVEEFMENPNFWASHVHPEDLHQVFAATAKLIEQGQHSQEYRFLHSNGTYRWMYDQVKLVQDDAGNPLEIVGYWLDITERKQLEEELKAALHKEKELNELKSRFVAMTSHEFRTPLSTILSSSELLEHYRHRWTEEKQVSHLHRIQTAVKHMTEMLNNVLVIGKAEAGKLDFIPVPFDLVKYCRYLVEELQLNVNNQHPINFIRQEDSMPCCMDEKLLEHILTNLLSNAIKYSPTGSTVRFYLTFKDGLAVFTIQDQGIGIPPEDLPHLFESFHRATNVGNIQGTGLGLAIVKKCVDTHNGEIAVKSEVGVGTIFTVTLPLNSHTKTEANYDKNFSY